MCEPVQQRCCHLCVTEDLRPFTEAEVGRDNDAGALIEFAQKVEQQCAARPAERQVAKLVEDDEVDLGEHLSHLPSLPKRLFLLERFSGLEHQRYKRAAPCCLLVHDADQPATRAQRLRHAHRTHRSQAYQVLIHQLNVAPLFARLPRLRQKPRRQPIRVRIQLARTRGVLNLGSTASSREILLDGVARQPVRRAISRIGILSRNAQRRMTLKNPMSITPCLP